MIKIYTDGSCLKNPGDGGWAAIISKDGKNKEISGRKMEKIKRLVVVKKIPQIIGWNY